MKLSIAATAFIAFAFLAGTAGNILASPKPQYADPVEPKFEPEHNITLAELLGADDEDPDPVVECKSDAKEQNDRCVPYLRFSDEVNQKTSKHIVKWIEAANKAGADELLLEINTPGGSVPDGFEVSRAIEDSDAPVTCIVDGDADSMGFYILQSCTNRIMTPRSKLMAHEPAIGGMAHGQPNFWIGLAEMMKAERDSLAIHCQHRLKVSLAEYHKRTDGGLMWWMLSNDAKKFGAIDGVKDSVKKFHKELLHKKPEKHKK